MYCTTHLEHLVCADDDFDAVADKEDDDDSDKRDGGPDGAPLLLAQASRNRPVQVNCHHLLY